MKSDTKARLGIALLVCLSSLVACSKSEKGAEADAAATPVASASAAMTSDAGAATGTPAPTEGVIAAIPTQDKADRKAAREITKTNYKTELDSLEKEIGQ